MKYPELAITCNLPVHSSMVEACVIEEHFTRKQSQAEVGFLPGVSAMLNHCVPAMPEPWH